MLGTDTIRVLNDTLLLSTKSQKDIASTVSLHSVKYLYGKL